MTIDIIDYKEEQYAELSDAQILEIRDAQKKKNARILKMYEQMRALERKAVDNGMLYSSSFSLQLQDVQDSCEIEVMQIRDELIFYLQFASRLEPSTESGYPLDYSLTLDERYLVLRDYYLDMYSDPSERYEEFQKDKVAKTYLCERYSVLLDYLWSLANM